MKKTLAIIMALSLLSCVSCNKSDDKKGNITATTPTIAKEEVTETENSTESPENPPAENVQFREFSLDDFQDMEINLTLQQNDIPESVATVKTYYLSEISYSNLTPQCAVEQDSDPNILCTAIDGEDLYYLVFYDTLCDHSELAYAPQLHCFEICRYNFETGENHVLYTYNDSENGYWFDDMKRVGSTLWLLGRCGDYSNPEYRIYALNLANDRLDEMLSVTGYKAGTFSDDNNDKVIFEAYENYGSDFDGYTNGYKGKYAFYELSDDSHQFELIAEGQCDKKNYDTIHGGEVVKVAEKDRNITVESENLRLSTGIRNSKLINFDENKVAFLTSDSVQSIIYTYDLNKKIRYITDITDYNKNPVAEFVNNNLLIRNDDNGEYIYVIYDIGAGFELKDISAESLSGLPADTMKQSQVYSQTSNYGNSTAIAVTSLHYSAPDNGYIGECELCPLERVVIIQEK